MRGFAGVSLKFHFRDREATPTTSDGVGLVMAETTRQSCPSFPNDPTGSESLKHVGSKPSSAGIQPMRWIRYVGETGDFDDST